VVQINIYTGERERERGGEREREGGRERGGDVRRVHEYLK